MRRTVTRLRLGSLAPRSPSQNSFFDFGLGGRMVFSLVGALIFVGYILYDTSLIIHHFGPDDYIIAAVTLYLDIINLFLYLLELLRMLQGGSSQ